MSRFWRRLLGLVLVLVLLLVLALFIEHWRGRRILAATVTELKARGALPVPEELFIPPGRSNGIQMLLTAAGRLRNPPLPPSMQGVVPGRAAESFRLTWWEERRGVTSTWDTLAAWGHSNAPALEQVRQALALPECRPAFDWRQGFNLPPIHLIERKATVTALAVDALLAAHEGDKEGVLANFEALRSLEQHFAREPVLISQLVRIAGAAIGWIRAWDVAQRDDWTEADLAALQRTLSGNSLAEGMVLGLECERVLWVQTMRQMRPEDVRDLMAGGFAGPDDDLFLPTSLDEAGGAFQLVFRKFADGLKEMVVVPLWRFAWYDQAEAYHLRTMAALVAHAREQARWQNASLPPPPEADIERLVSSASWFDRLRYWLTYQTIPALEKAMSRALRSQTERAQVETGIALRRHQLRHGRLPERLEQLVPDFLAAVPVDGMDGRPLRYRVNNDGTYALWSVGEDLEDHGGDPTPKNPNSRSLNWRFAKDAVLPLRASDAEFAQWQAAELAKGLKSQRTAGGTNVPTMSAELMRRYGLMPAATNAPAAPR